MIHEWANWGNY